MSNQKFNEEAVRQIIRIAMEKEKNEKQSAANEQGLSLEELVSIGKDVGLSEDEIREAAKRYANTSFTRHFKVTNTEIIEERFFKSDADKNKLWEHLQFELDDHFGDSTIFGAIGAAPREYQWRHTSASGVETKATLRSEDDGYRLRLSQRVGMAAPLWEGISIGIIPTLLLMSIFYAVFRLDSVLLNFAFAGGIWGISSYIIYKLDVAWRNKKQRQLKELADTLAIDLPEPSTEISSENNIIIEDPDVYSGEQHITDSQSSKLKE